MRILALLLIALPAVFANALDQDGDVFAKAQDLYNRADYQTSLNVLHDDARRNRKADALAGKDYYMLGDYKKAIEAFERALRAEPGNGEYALWLGRSYGRRAETASPLFASKYASRAREYFEKAVALDPNNEDALSDLFHYYLEAPGFLGGGYQKAEAIAKRIAENNPAEGHLAQAELADRRKQFDTAEEQLRWAVQVAPHRLGHLLDLARYLAKHGQVAESESVFDQAEKLAPNSPRIDFARAQLYVEQHRNLPEAKALLERYLQSNLTSSDPPRVQAEKLLKKASRA